MLNQNAQDPLGDVQTDGGFVYVSLMDDQTIARGPQLICPILDTVEAIGQEICVQIGRCPAGAAPYGHLYS